MKKSNTSERLKELMDARGLKQVDILRLCEPYCKKYGIKLNKNDLSQYVSGKVSPGQDKLTILGLALGVDEVWLMGYDTDIPLKSNRPRPDPEKNPRLVPVYGSVPAGIPIEAIEDIIDYEEITEEMARCGEYFGLIIKGDSMIPDLKEKDVVIVRKQEDAESGDIVIALVNGNDACCKRLMKYAGGVQLLSNNPAYEPMMFTFDADAPEPVRIIGKVVESRRKY